MYSSVGAVSVVTILPWADVRGKQSCTVLIRYFMPASDVADVDALGAECNTSFIPFF